MKQACTSIIGDRGEGRVARHWMKQACTSIIGDRGEGRVARDEE